MKKPKASKRKPVNRIFKQYHTLPTEHKMRVDTIQRERGIRIKSTAAGATAGATALATGQILSGNYRGLLGVAPAAAISGVGAFAITSKEVKTAHNRLAKSLGRSHPELRGKRFFVNRYGDIYLTDRKLGLYQRHKIE